PKGRFRPCATSTAPSSFPSTWFERTATEYHAKLRLLDEASFKNVTARYRRRSVRRPELAICTPPFSPTCTRPGRSRARKKIRAASLDAALIRRFACL